MKIKYLHITPVIILLILLCAGTGYGQAVIPDNLKDRQQPFISIDLLKNQGFKHTSVSEIMMLMHNGFLYVQSGPDKRIVKFKDMKAVKTFQAEAGTAPGQLAKAGPLFVFDDDTLALIDGKKRCIMFFNLDLEPKGEKKLETATFGLLRAKRGGFLARGVYDNFLLARLNKDLKVIDRHIKLDVEAYRKRLFQHVVLLDEASAALTTGVYDKKDCKIDIFDTDKKKFVLSLKWQQSHPLPSLKEISSSHNIYHFSMLKKYGNYYVNQNAFVKVILPFQAEYDLIVFDAKGKPVLRLEDFPYPMTYINGGKRLHFFIKGKGYYTMDIQSLLTGKKK